MTATQRLNREAILSLFQLEEAGIEKVCCTCRCLKPVTSFYEAPLSRAPSGYYPRCKDCSVEHAREWHKANVEYARERDRRRYQQDLEANRERHRNWMAANRERNREYRRRTAEARSIYNAAWAKANPEKIRDKAARRRAAIRDNGVFRISERDLLRLYRAPCASCGAREDIHADHIVPVSRGGRHSIGNLQPLCSACNLSKGDRLMVEWRHR